MACNALYKNANNFNCYLTPPQAIALAQHLVQKAQLILDENLADAAVQLWNKGTAARSCTADSSKPARDRVKGPRSLRPVMLTATDSSGVPPTGRLTPNPFMDSIVNRRTPIV